MNAIKRLLRNLGYAFLKGLGSVLPVFITLYLLYWLLATTENGLGPLLKRILPDAAYVPGMGIAVGVAAVLIVGILANAWGFRSLVSYIGSLIERIPLIKSIYGALRDFVQFFSASNERKFSKVVCVHLTPQCRLIGFVTREDAHVMVDEKPGEEKLIAVYMPMSYQIGGYTMVLPESMTHPLDLSIEDAMRTVITGGVSISAGKRDAPPSPTQSGPKME